MNSKTNAEEFMSIDGRNKLIERVEVLDNVKELFLLPQLEMMTSQQVADYYEVGLEAIKSCYKEHHSEIDEDGTIIHTKSTVKLMVTDRPIVSEQGSTTFDLGGGVLFKVPNRGIRMFSKRAILRIGMLLRDSKIAREVRTQLLNTFEHTSKEQRTEEIRTEKEILANYGWAILYGTREQIQKSVKDLVDYNGRYTKRLEKNCNELKTAVDLLTHQTREWTPRQVVNRLCRYYASSCLGGSFQAAYRQLYQELLYKKKMSLSQRTGGKCLLDRVRDDEWDDVVETAVALCIAKGIDIASVVNEVNASKT